MQKHRCTHTHTDAGAYVQGTRGLMELTAAEVQRSPALLHVYDPVAAARLVRRASMFSRVVWHMP